MIANNENPTKETMRFPSYMTLGKSIKTAEVDNFALALGKLKFVHKESRSIAAYSTSGFTCKLIFHSRYKGKTLKLTLR